MQIESICKKISLTLIFLIMTTVCLEYDIAFI